jgi:hypothetical protein
VSCPFQKVRGDSTGTCSAIQQDRYTTRYPPPTVGADTVDVLRDWGIADIDRVIDAGVVQEPSSTQA